MKRILAIIAFVLAAFIPSHAFAANTWGTDLSDLWWNPYESGWGANIAHQGDVIFLTLFVYDVNSGAKWYVGPAITSNGGADAFTYSGELYETRGPYIGNMFNPDEVSVRAVGIATIVFPAGTEARLSYTVDGISNTKWIRRQTFRANNLNGHYMGATIGVASGCVAGSGAFTTPAEFTIIHQDYTEMSMNVSAGGVSCTYSGLYAQYGRMGGFEGPVSCTNGRVGTFQAYEIEAGYQGFAARYSADFGGGCVETGRMGGMKRE